MNSSEARDTKTRQRLELTKQTLRKLSPHPILIQTLHSSTKLYSFVKTRKKKSKNKNKLCSFTSRFIYFLTHRSRATGRPEETAAETLYEGKPCLLLLVRIHSKTNWSQVVRRREVSSPLETEERRGGGRGEEKRGEGVQLKSQCGWDLVLWGLNVCGRGTELIGVFFCCKFTLHRFLLGGKSSRSLFNMPTLSRLRTFEAKSHGLLAVFSLTLR